MHPTRSPGPALRPICIGDDSPGPLSAVLPQEAHPSCRPLPSGASACCQNPAAPSGVPGPAAGPATSPGAVSIRLQVTSAPGPALPEPGAGPGVSCRPPSGSRPLQRPARHPGNAATGCRSAGCSTPQRAPIPQKPQGRGPHPQTWPGWQQPCRAPQPAVARRTRNPPVPGFCWLQCPLLPPAISTGGPRESPGSSGPALGPERDPPPPALPCTGSPGADHPTHRALPPGAGKTQEKAEGRHSASGPFGQTPCISGWRDLPGSAQAVACSSALSNSRSA